MPLSSVFADLGVSLPVFAAPMAGGGTTVEMVVAAAAAGSFGSIAGGYKSVDALREQLAAVRAATEIFGVNLFAPNPAPIDPRDYAAYAAEIRPDIDAVGAGEAPSDPKSDDDAWADKVAVLVESPAPIVTVTFGLPPADDLRRLQRAGSAVGQTITNAEEARAALDLGVDFLVVQGVAAGGHSAIFDPTADPAEVPLNNVVQQISALTNVPIIAAGGIQSGREIRSALDAGAAATMVGTLLLRSTESGAAATHRAALAATRGVETIITRAFTGRPARALPNGFTAAHSATAPTGYPALHHLTGPMRRAAAIAGNADRLHLWAGRGYERAEERSTAEILVGLAREV